MSNPETPLILRDLPGYDAIQEHVADCVASADHPQEVALAFVEASIRVALPWVGAPGVARLLKETADQIEAVVREVEAEHLRGKH